MNKINILIPMAGLGERFKTHGFKNIKPLIPLNGKTFIEWSIESVDFNNIETQFIFIILEEHKIILEEFLYSIKPNCIILTTPHVTRGASETALIAKSYIDNDVPLIITNCDQILEWNKEKYIEYLKTSNTEADVVVFNANSPKFSYILLDDNNKGIKLTEKEVISNNALVGIHYWKRGCFFVNSAELLIQKNIRCNNEFYVSITYNILIEQNIQVSCYKLNEFDNNVYDKDDDVLTSENTQIIENNENYEKYLSIGTPEQVIDYLNYKNINVKVDNIYNYTRGWFIGNFEPSILKNSGVELGYLSFKKGEQIDYHYHEHCKEINLLVKGKMIVNNKVINEGDIFIFDEMVPTFPIYLEDTSLVVLKNTYSNKDKIIM